MGTSPNKGGSGAGFGFVVVAIVAAVAIGAVAKSKRSEEDDGSRSPDAPHSEPKPIVLAGSVSGAGWPKDRDGKPASLTGYLLEGFHPVAWARLDFEPQDTPYVNPLLGVEASIVDEKGIRWPCLSMWKYPSIYYLLPQGYQKRPQHLKVKAYGPLNPSIAGVDPNGLVATIDLPEVPPPSPLTPPKLSPAWNGLSLTPALVSSGPDNSTQDLAIQVDSYVPTGHIVQAKVIGASGSLWGSAAYLVLNERTTRGTTNVRPSYPTETKTVYVEVTERIPQSVRKVVTFTDVPVLSRFGEAWIVGFSRPVKIAEDLQGVLGGSNGAPFHAPSRSRRTIPLGFRYSGRAGNVNCELLTPKNFMSASLGIMETQPVGAAELTPDRTPMAGSTSLTATVEIQATVFPVVRRTVVAVDMTPVLRQMRKPTSAITQMDSTGAPAGAGFILPGGRNTGPSPRPTPD